jgi:hypothetical protein
MEGLLIPAQIFMLIYIAGFLLSAAFDHNPHYNFVGVIVTSIFWPIKVIFRMLGW